MFCFAAFIYLIALYALIALHWIISFHRFIEIKLFFMGSLLFKKINIFIVSYHFPHWFKSYLFKAHLFKSHWLKALPYIRVTLSYLQLEELSKYMNDRWLRKEFK